MSAPLSKKQQKALAFRSKQKAKKGGAEAPPDLPEEDIVEDDVVQPEEKTVDVAAGKKRKRDVETEEGAKPQEEEEKVSQKGKETEKKKRKTAWDEDGDDKDGKKATSKKDIKQRFILFVGNLGFKTTREEVQKHFEPAVGHLPAVRLLTTKATPTQASKPRGIAFIELPSSTALQACLKLHHSDLNGREINVELTAGGGGQSQDRKKKIDERNQRVGGQRERKAEKEREAFIAGGGIDGEGAVEPVQEKEGGDRKKMRGGRRVKAKSGDVSTPAAPAQPYTARPANPANRYTSGKPPGKQPFAKKWQPTGANSITVSK